MYHLKILIKETPIFLVEYLYLVLLEHNINNYIINNLLSKSININQEVGIATISNYTERYEIEMRRTSINIFN